MAKAQDFTATMKEFMGAFPVDTAAFQDAYKTSTTLNEKLSKVTLDAVEKSTDLSTKWAKETIAKFGEITTAKADPADYTKSLTDFATSSAESSAEHIAAFAEIAKKVQSETVELMLAAGKDMSEEATAAVKKATDEVASAAKKAAAK